jgi:hypothetical protein
LDVKKVTAGRHFCLKAHLAKRLHNSYRVLLDSVNVSQDPSRFVMALRRHSWAWLFQLRRRLNVEVQIVDSRGHALLPDQAIPAVLHRPEVLAAVERAATSGQLELVNVPQMQTSCAALAFDGAGGGILVVARELAAAPDPQTDAQHELGLLTTWLRASIDVHLSAEPALSLEPYSRLAALRKALSAPEAAASEFGALRVFGQALAIWEDIEVHGYLQDRSGRLVKRVSPAGQNVTVIPDVLRADLIPRTRELARVPPQTIRQLEIHSTDDAHAVFVGGSDEGPSWFLLLAGATDPSGEDRLAVYVDFLRQWLEAVLVARTLQLHHAIWRNLLADDGQIDRSAHAALEEISAAASADTAALVVTLPRGGTALAVGEPTAFAEGRPLASGNSVKLSRPLPNRGRIVLAVGRREGADFTPGERRLLESAIDTLIPWATGVLRRPEYQTERRVAARAFGESFDDVAAHATALGTGVSVLVIRLADTLFNPGLTHDVAAWVKSHLRALETAGTLTDGEVAALLYDTTLEQASAVVARLRRIADLGDVGEALRSASIEVAYCPPGVPYQPAVLAVARERAAHRSGAGPTIQ